MGLAALRRCRARGDLDPGPWGLPVGPVLRRSVGAAMAVGLSKNFFLSQYANIKMCMCEHFLRLVSIHLGKYYILVCPNIPVTQYEYLFARFT